MVPWSEFPNSESAAHLHFPQKLVAKVAHYIIEYISSATERSNRTPSGLNRLLIWASVDRLLSHRSRARLSSTLKRQRQGAASDKWATKTFAQQDIRRGRSRSEAPREKKWVGDNRQPRFGAETTCLLQRWSTVRFRLIEVPSRPLVLLEPV